MQDKILPSVEHEERSLLGHVLAYEHLQAEFFDLARPEYFSLDSNRRIFRAMARAYESGKSFDISTIQTELIDRNELSAVGGAAYLTDLTTGTVRTYRIESHIETLRDRWARRRMIGKLSAATDAVYDSSQRVEEICQRIEGDLLEIEGGSAAEVFSLEDFALQEMDRISQERNAKGELLGIPTGLEVLDRTTTGFRAGEMTIIGAWPGRGKTSLLLQSAYHAAANGFPVLLLSLEMRKEELLRRLLALKAQISYRKLRNPREMTLTEYEGCLNATGSLVGLPLYVCDEGSLDPAQITSLARLKIRQHKIAILFVDFVQIVNESGRDTRDVVNKISAGLRKLAKRENIPVVAASQLGRPRDRNPNEIPTLFHLRESGNLEQDAHNVFLIYRPLDSETGQFTGEDQIIIAKQRHGVVGNIPVQYDSRQLVFRSRQNGR